MLNELGGLQQSDEELYAIDMSFEIQTRLKESDELIQREYTFGYAKEWDKWTVTEYIERRSPYSKIPSQREWRDSKRLTWDDTDLAKELSIPEVVTQRLSKATGGADVSIQVPRGTDIMGDTDG